MLFSAQIKDLQNQLSAMTGERDTLATANAELTQANAECAQRFDADQGTIQTLTTERDTAVQNLSTANTERDSALADLKAERESREQTINSQVTQRLSDAGVDPIKRDPNAAPEPAAENTGAGRTKATWGRDFSGKR